MQIKKKNKLTLLVLLCLCSPTLFAAPTLFEFTDENIDHSKHNQHQSNFHEHHQNEQKQYEEPASHNESPKHHKHSSQNEHSNHEMLDKQQSNELNSGTDKKNSDESVSLSQADSEHNHHDMHDMHDMLELAKNRLVPANYFGLPKNEPLKPLLAVKNMSSEPGVFKATLEPKPVVKQLSEKASPELWLYNGEILPLIEINAGDKVDITVKNQLPEETTVHWHGLAVPPSEDGNPQDAIVSKSEKTYSFTTDSDMVGTHWFHPHTHLKTSTQVAKGLAGAFIIRDPNDPLRDFPEQILFFSDLKLDKQGQIAKNDTIDIMNGREGQFALVNGQWEPEIDLEGSQRWRLLNGNSARYLNFYFPKDKVDVALVATDGGLIESPQMIETLLLTPGERAEIIITPKSNKPFSLIAMAYDRDKMGPVPKEQDLVLAKINPKIGNTMPIPKKLATLTPLGKPMKTRQVVYTEEMSPLKFLINGLEHDMSRVDFKMNKGEVELWEITNQSHMDHNFHMHGPQFQVIEFERNGVTTKPSFTLFKDTINVRPGETIRVLTKQEHSGIRMFHCHILEHEDAGMMGQVEVL